MLAQHHVHNFQSGLNFNSQHGLRRDSGTSQRRAVFRTPHRTAVRSTPGTNGHAPANFEVPSGELLPLMVENANVMPSIPADGKPLASAHTGTETLYAEPKVVEQPIERHSLSQRKADFYILRTDGKSCMRETVKAPGTISFAHPSTNQYMLVWQTRPRRTLVIKKPGVPEIDASFRELVHYLGREQRLRVIVEPTEYNQLANNGAREFVETFSELEKQRLHEFVDFVVCLGGDGVLLHASHLFYSGSPPMLSFNLGSMGFLTNHSFSTYRDHMHRLMDGSEDVSMCSVDNNLQGVAITLRMRLRCEIHRAGQAGPSDVYEVLNEVVVNRGSNPYLTLLECWEQDTLITKIQADGVMLATPTGSTAYSVAAGGSMVHPGVNAILLTPVCPHSLSFRPIILPDYADLELRVPDDARCSAFVCFDGKHRQELNRGDHLRVRMSPNPVPTINLNDQTSDWFNSLQRCFGWNNRTEQKPMKNAT